MNTILAEQTLLHQDNSQISENEDLSVTRAKELQIAFSKRTLPEGFVLDDEGVWFHPQPKK